MLGESSSWRTPLPRSCACAAVRQYGDRHVLRHGDARGRRQLVDVDAPVDRRTVDLHVEVAVDLHMRVHVIEAEPRCAHVELEAVARQAPHMRLLRLHRAFDRRHIPLRHPDDHRHVVFRERFADAGAATHLHVEAFGPVVDRDLEVARQVGHGVRHDPHTQLLAVIPTDRARVDRPAVDVEMLAAVDVVVRGAFIPVFAARRPRARRRRRAGRRRSP